MTVVSLQVGQIAVGLIHTLWRDGAVVPEVVADDKRRFLTLRMSSIPVSKVFRDHKIVF
jgi:hypothetical protein